MVNIYVVRHGEYENNVTQKINIKYENNRHLTLRGIEQSQKTHSELKGIEFDRVIVSDFVRTKETAKEITDITPEIRDEIDELQVGVEEMDYTIHDERMKKQIEQGFVEKEDEDVKDRIETLKEFLDELKNSDNKNILVVTHKDVMRLIKIINENLNINDFYSIDLKNCEIYKIEDKK